MFGRFSYTDICWLYQRQNEQKWRRDKEEEERKIREDQRQIEIAEKEAKKRRRDYLRQRKKDEPLVRQVCELLEEGRISMGEIKNKLNIDDINFVRMIYWRELYPEISEKYNWDYNYKASITNLNSERLNKVITLLTKSHMTIDEIAKEVDVRPHIIKDILCGRRYTKATMGMNLFVKHYNVLHSIFTSDSEPDSLWKSIIADGRKTDYETNIFGVIRNIITHDIITPMTTQFINNYEVPDIYKMDINGDKIRVHRDRLLASLWVPIPKYYTDISPKYLSVGQKEYILIGHKEMDLMTLTPTNLYWYFDYSNNIDLRSVRNTKEKFSTRGF